MIELFVLHYFNKYFLDKGNKWRIQPFEKKKNETVILSAYPHIENRINEKRIEGKERAGEM